MSSQFHEASESLLNELKSAGVYVDITYAHESVSKRLREARPLNYNYVIVFGANEAESNTFTPKPRDDDGAIPISTPVNAKQFITLLKSLQKP